MPTLNGRNYTGVPGLNIREANGAIRFETPLITPATTSGERILYVNSSNELVYNNGTAAVVLGAAGASAGTPTLDAIYASDKTLTVGNGTLTLAGNMATADNVLTITNIAGSSGAAIAFTNSTTTNYDLLGTGSSWSITGAGVAVLEELTIDGTEGSNIFTVTKGDVRFLDGSLAITDDDNAASFTLTNNTATTASVAVIAGSGTFTGSTTSSFMTITPSGLTSGTAVYLPVAALDTGRAIHVVANALTSGIVFNVTSSATAITGNGRLFLSTHSGATGSSATLNEFITAANDETVLLKLTASDVLAAGRLLQVSAGSMTTGKAITANDLDALTTGMGIHVASAATAITTTGRLFLSDHTGTTGTSATLNEFKTAATDETILMALTAADMATGTMLSFGTNTALTTGVLISAVHTTSVIADGGSMLRLSSTGINTGGATNGTMIDCQTTNQVAGTQVLFKAGAVTTGVVLSLISTTGMTSGSLLRATSSTAGAVATNGVISIRATGAFTSTSNVGYVDVLASATTAGTVMRIASSAAGQTATELLRVHASGFTTGYTGNVVNIISTSTTGASNALLVTTDASTAGNGVKIVADSLTTGTGLLVTSSGTITSAGEGLVNIVGTGITSGTALKIDLTEGTLNGGKYIDCYDDTSSKSVFSVSEDGKVLFSDFTEVVTGTNVITADESGSVFFLNSATEFVSTLPAVQAGLHFTFICTAAPSGANYTVVTNGSSNVILGTVHSSDGVDGDSELVGADTVNFVDGQAHVGDRVEFWCDGTNWFALAHCDISTGITITTAS